MLTLDYQPCATVRARQTDDDREEQDVLDCLARLDWDALRAALDGACAPVAEMSLATTQELRAVPETPAAFRPGDQAHDHLREELWVASALAADDEWTDEPTVANHRFPG